MLLKPKIRLLGYCIYYLKQAFSFKCFEKQSVLWELIIDMNYRGEGFAERLLKESIKEMKLNGISFITLYVLINNHHAIQLYKKLVLGQLLRLKMYVAMRRLITKWNWNLFNLFSPDPLNFFPHRELTINILLVLNSALH